MMGKGKEGVVGGVWGGRLAVGEEPLKWGPHLDFLLLVFCDLKEHFDKFDF